MPDDNREDDDIDEAADTAETSVQRHDYLYETDNPNTETSEIDGSLFAPPTWKKFLKEAGIALFGTLYGALMASAFFTSICALVGAFFPPAAALIPIVAVVSAIGGGYVGFINADAIFEGIKKAISDSTDLGAEIGQFFRGLFGRNDNTLSSNAVMNNGLGVRHDSPDQLNDALAHGTGATVQGQDQDQGQDPAQDPAQDQDQDQDQGADNDSPSRSMGMSS